MSKRFLKTIGFLALIICGSHVLPKANTTAVRATFQGEGTYVIRCDTQNRGPRCLTYALWGGAIKPWTQVAPTLLYTADITQQWTLVQEGEGYTIRNFMIALPLFIQQNCMEAYPNCDDVRARPKNGHQDQTWYIESVDNSHKNKIFCHTRKGGKRYLEAFPNEDAVRPRTGSTHQDQYWEFLRVN